VLHCKNPPNVPIFLHIHLWRALLKASFLSGGEYEPKDPASRTLQVMDPVMDGSGSGSMYDSGSGSVYDSGSGSMYDSGSMGGYGASGSVYGAYAVNGHSCTAGAAPMVVAADATVQEGPGDYYCSCVTGVVRF
jgi:hypothetical protein